MTSDLHVLMVGDCLNQRGGIATMQAAHLASAPGHIRTTHVATHDEGSRPYRVRFFLKSLRHLSHLFATVPIDLVHIHQSGGGSLVRKSVIVRMARRNGVPTVVHGHAGWSDSTLRGMPGVLRRFVTSSLSKADAVIALSHAWASWYHTAVGVPADRIRVVHTPSPEIHVGPSTTNDVVRIISVSRLREDKGTFDLLRAFAALDSELLAQSELVLAGDGDLSETRSLAESLGISDKVLLPGWVVDEELIALLQSADIFVSASHHEGIPLSLLEALSTGLPSISTDVGGVPEVVTDGVDCLLVSPQAHAELVDALTHLVDQPDQRDRLSAGALRLAKANSVERYWEAIEDVYACAGTGVRSSGPRDALGHDGPLQGAERASVSIIVPTFNRAPWLGAALDSLMVQVHDATIEYEIVVVDNASTDHTAEVVQKAAARSAVPLRYVYEPVQGDGAARNRGVLTARHDLLAFFDDDQFADPHWISSLVEGVRSTGASIIGGPVVLDLDQSERNRFGMVTRRDMLRESIPYDHPRPYEAGQLPGTCNVMVSRSVFGMVGMFDAEMNGGSDFEFLRRAAAVGFAPWFTPEATVVHRVGAYRRTHEYFRRESARNGWGLAEQTLTERGSSALVVECAARITQAVFVNLPLLALARLRSNSAEETDRRVLLWRAEGFLRRTSARVAPKLWAQEHFAATHQFAGYESQQIERENVGTSDQTPTR